MSQLTLGTSKLSVPRSVQMNNGFGVPTPKKGRRRPFYPPLNYEGFNNLLSIAAFNKGSFSTFKFSAPF